LDGDVIFERGKRMKKPRFEGEFCSGDCHYLGHGKWTCKKFKDANKNRHYVCLPWRYKRQVNPCRHEQCLAEHGDGDVWSTTPPTDPGWYVVRVADAWSNALIEYLLVLVMEIKGEPYYYANANPRKPINCADGAYSKWASFEFPAPTEDDKSYKE
jgi:hypothetical protein